MLRQQVDGVVPFQQGDVGMTPHRSHQRTFDLGARQVLVVQDAVLRVAPLAVQLEPPVGRLVEARAPCDQVADQLGSTAHHQLHGGRIAFSGAAHQRIADVFFERVGGIRHRTDTALRIVGVALVQFAFGDDGDTAVFGRFEREAQTRRTRKSVCISKVRLSGTKVTIFHDTRKRRRGFSVPSPVWPYRVPPRPSSCSRCIVAKRRASSSPKRPPSTHSASLPPPETTSTSSASPEGAAE